MENLNACMAYIEKLPAAVSGSGGHNATLQAALACKRFGLSGDEMWNVMRWFNEHRCQPKWSEKELRHKVDSVLGVVITRPLGQRHGFKRSKAFVAPAMPETKADERPMCQRSEQDEELWWERAAAERGTTLEAWDE